MKKKLTHFISAEEKQLFRDAVFDVKPLKTTSDFEKQDALIESKPVSEKISIKQVSRQSAAHFPEEKTIFCFDQTQPEMTGSDVMSFARPGLQHKRFSQFKQGKIRAEATLDLHEHTSDAAIQAVDHFLMRCQYRGLRAVCIIHGKGHFSANNKPILKNLLNNYLRVHPCVLAFHSAKNKAGGTGAMMVLIKTLPK
ncbi:MAG: DNA mismatch repair protein MutS [Gammaproteobacteria bacterium CG_4_10_14_0_8_um_filter_38_16]|nr:MAG: DNA mismatch repair protein MutS [Gammaproteobacteria bacterium CG_4_10_14_0_8_um_filter_38_16]PJA02798.1 MAG: DNA mismatch repair protein MutS [Gammaproteobacteria bacterium CG_4_10_14_0_2_um_filter_38_22]PJB10711.1 MAG: DNA mismatch repair protein MutS [Gammaproteobacteria bacterium CG_4_9_14_3_um_filter_38_9]